MKVAVSEKGQVTIPKALRERLGIQPGSQIDFVEVEGELVGRKVMDRDPVDAAWGVLRSRGRHTDELLAELRDGSR